MNPSLSTGVKPVRSTSMVRPPAYIQGAYWILTGIWPLFHRASFEWVTGPKFDFWLVQLVGSILAVIGATMILARARNRITPEISFLAIASTTAIILLTVFYVARERIAPTYLIDVAAEILLLVGWLRWVMLRPRHHAVVVPSDALASRSLGIGTH